MKKILFLIIIAGIYSCNEKPKKTDDPKKWPIYVDIQRHHLPDGLSLPYDVFHCKYCDTTKSFKYIVSHLITELESRKKLSSSDFKKLDSLKHEMYLINLCLASFGREEAVRENYESYNDYIKENYYLFHK